MLYATTRSNLDFETANRALCENRAPNGGFYVPFRAPQFSQEEILTLGKQTFNTSVAMVLNRLFNARLTAFDVDFCIGRYSVRLSRMSQRILMGECWHNLDGNVDRIIANLYRLLRTGGSETDLPGEWAGIAVRIAVVFGLFGELLRTGAADLEKKVDVSVVSGDFSAPMALWYAREWGLPIGNIILCCNENGGLWDLFNRGQMRTDLIAVPTSTPEADVALPAGLERLIYECGGTGEVNRFLDACRRGGTYFPGDFLYAKLRKGFHVSVVSQKRILRTIPSVYGTTSCVLSSHTALAYAGLMDYRAGTGESRTALVMAKKSPARDLDTVARSLGIGSDVLKRHLD